MSNKTTPTKNEKAIPIKVILVGESGVGKTSIILSLLNRYQGKTEVTLGAYFSNKTIIIDGYKLDFEIWDTAGQEQYRAINSLFYKDTSICLLVYDITKKGTFESIKNYWYYSVVENGREGIIFGIAGNKMDLFEDEEVSEKELEEFSNSINACYNLTSAKVFNSVNDIFVKLGKKFIESNFMKELIPQYITKDSKPEDKIDPVKVETKIKEKKIKKESRCC